MMVDDEMVRGLARRRRSDRIEKIRKFMDALQLAAWIFLNIAAATVLILVAVL